MVKCDDCKHSHWEEFDPSPSGISLSAGSMYDWSCGKEGELPEDFDPDGEEDHNCPCFERFTEEELQRMWDEDEAMCRGMSGMDEGRVS